MADIVPESALPGGEVAVLVPPMALSRVLLGVHYPSDVATGVAVGAAIAATAVRIDRRVKGGARQ
jgi:membrane-associated phospholipid phosphatase